MNTICKDIQLVATDCDGVLTDGGLYYTEKGDAMRRFCVLDGLGFIRLHEKRFITAIITASNNAMIKMRACDLGINHLLVEVKDKLYAVQDLCKRCGFSIDQVAYIGDDIPDIPLIKMCGFGCAPTTALQAVKENADYVTHAGGGYGCFREVAELIIDASSAHAIN